MNSPISISSASPGLISPVISSPKTPRPERTSNTSPIRGKSYSKEVMTILQDLHLLPGPEETSNPEHWLHRLRPL
ncbi:hypothetical protein SK128_010175, partial [Halocaridina rubra]